MRVSEAVGERDECYKRTTWEIAPGCDSCLVCRQTELYDVVCKKEGCNERGGGPDVGCDVDESEDGTEAEDAAGSRRLAPATTRSAATAPAAATVYEQHNQEHPHAAQNSRLVSMCNTRTNVLCSVGYDYGEMLSPLSINAFRASAAGRATGFPGLLAPLRNTSTRA